VEEFVEPDSPLLRFVHFVQLPQAVVFL
jgi:hypothetical protein